MLQEREEKLWEATSKDLLLPLTISEIVCFYKELLSELTFNSKLRSIFFQAGPRRPKSQARKPSQKALQNIS